jgi:hypothetical protein
VKITIESTTKLVTMEIRGASVPARVWQGQTESGVPVQAFITRIAPEIPQSDPRIDELTADFERELQRCADPRPTVQAIDYRFLID